MAHIVALNPTSCPPPPEALGRRLESLRGASVGFFSNNKPNADVLLRRMAANLQTRFAIKSHFFANEVPSLEAGSDLLDTCAETCNAIVLAVYD